MLDKALLARRFGRAAPRYERHAVVQARAARALLAALPADAAAAPRARVLDVGCGTGLLTAGLLEVRPEAQILGLDLAPGMVAEAARRLAGKDARFTVGDVEEGFPEERFDLIASSMALQWVQDPAAVLRRAAAHLAPGGALALAVPVEGTLPELREAWAEAARALSVPTWRHPGLAFHAAERWEAWARGAFDEVRLETDRVVERHADARAALESIRGVGGADCGGGAGPAAVRLLRRALAEWDVRHRAPAGVAATWRLAVLLARRPRRIPA